MCVCIYRFQWTWCCSATLWQWEATLWVCRLQISSISQAEPGWVILFMNLYRLFVQHILPFSFTDHSDWQLRKVILDSGDRSLRPGGTRTDPVWVQQWVISRRWYRSQSASDDRFISTVFCASREPSTSTCCRSLLEHIHASAFRAHRRQVYGQADFSSLQD